MYLLEQHFVLKKLEWNQDRISEDTEYSSLPAKSRTCLESNHSDDGVSTWI